MEQALRQGKPIEQIRKKYGWIKVRDGFSAGFTAQELKTEQNKMRGKLSIFIRPKIPGSLVELSKVAQELVYFRTLRTDILYEFMWKARPLLKRVAKYFDIGFDDLRHYSVHDLLNRKPERFRDVTGISWGRDFALIEGPIFNDHYEAVEELRGTIAFCGKATSVAKVVMSAREIGKVKQGDILIAPTTAPSYLMGMKKASAFVTDEGGITSHAAIIAREMYKPCIIGTKIATKIFKDGDFVEVDADRGIVKKI